MSRVSEGRGVIVREESVEAMTRHADVPCWFEVTEVLDVATPARGLGGIHLALRPVMAPYLKDYDKVNPPSGWGSLFDLTACGWLGAWHGDVRVGGAVVALGVPELEPRDDVAVLWDLRIAPASRRSGIGRALFHAAERWASLRGARWLQAETQNINVNACRFYAGQGCVLGAVNRFAYPSLPDEVQLLWYKELTGVPGGG